MSGGRVLVAGIGNIFHSDDGFGSEVARRLLTEPDPLPEGVKVTDFGIRGIHLAYELLDGYDLVVLVDALPRGEEPGTVSLLQPEIDLDTAPPLDAHRMDPRAVLATVAGMGGEVGRLLLVGCEPADVEERIGLSPAVAAAVDRAADLVDDLVSGREIP